MTVLVLRSQARFFKAHFQHAQCGVGQSSSAHFCAARLCSSWQYRGCSSERPGICSEACSAGNTGNRSLRGVPVTLPRASLITRQSIQSMKRESLRLVLLLPFLPQKAHMRFCIGSSPSGGSSSTSSSDDDGGGGGDGDRPVVTSYCATILPPSITCACLLLCGVPPPDCLLFDIAADAQCGASGSAAITVYRAAQQLRLVHPDQTHACRAVFSATKHLGRLSRRADSPLQCVH